VNNNSYKVEISWAHFNWELGGLVVQQGHGQSDTWNAGQTKDGDGYGLWWYPPKEYDMHKLDIRFMAFTVKKVD
jgi:hypothetical protein